MRGESSAASGPVSTWSPFSDPDVYPNTLEYWGPTGIPWFRNVQLRYTPISTDHSNFMLALARPGASGDQGVYADRIELEGIRARFPLPDFAAAYKFSGDWGYVRTAGMLRRINWDDTLDDAFDLSGDATGWGWNVSSNLKHGEGDVLRMQFTVGEGIQNEMNDSPVDIGIARNLSDPVRPVVGEPVPIVAVGHLPGSQVERQLQHRDRLLVAGERQHRCPGTGCVQDWPLRAWQPPLLSRART